jgi:hypothetical protein
MSAAPSSEREDPRNWRPAKPEEVATALAYSLIWDARGKPHGKRMAELRQAIAKWQVEHLVMSGFVLMKKPPAPRHVAGGGPSFDPKPD